MQFLSANSIFHRLSCPHTLQQNGLVDRKYRHIMEIELTLLVQSGLPKKF
jgi:histone deacetylase 1/2